MGLKLFTIGDSISQGFMSGAAARTDLCYLTIIAEILLEKKYNYPSWDKGGMLVNIEQTFRKLQKRLGVNISGVFQWPIVINLINNYLDEISKQDFIFSVIVAEYSGADFIERLFNTHISKIGTTENAVTSPTLVANALPQNNVSETSSFASNERDDEPTTNL